MKLDLTPLVRIGTLLNRSREGIGKRAEDFPIDLDYDFRLIFQTSSSQIVKDTKMGPYIQAPYVLVGHGNHKSQAIKS